MGRSHGSMGAQGAPTLSAKPGFRQEAEGGVRSRALRVKARRLRGLDCYRKVGKSQTGLSSPPLVPASPIRCLRLWAAFPEPRPAECSIRSESYQLQRFQAPSLHPRWSSSHQNQRPCSSPLHVSGPFAFDLQLAVSKEGTSISPLPESKLSHLTRLGR